VRRIMMEIKVNSATVELRTVKLTRALLKQMPRLTYREIGPLCEGGSLKPEHVVGWIHGSVLGDEWSRYALVAVRPGEYGVAELADHDTKKYKQIYIV
jgi:hypothetical protein